MRTLLTFITVMLRVETLCVWVCVGVYKIN